VDPILSQLDAISASYLQQELPLHFEEGSAEAVRELQKPRGFSGPIDETFTQVHREALQQLADDATLRFATALEGVRRSAQSAISKATKQAIINKLIQSEIAGQANPAVDTKQILEDAGIVAIQSTIEAGRPKALHPC
jgi:hypothetical protein